LEGRQTKVHHKRRTKLVMLKKVGRLGDDGTSVRCQGLRLRGVKDKKTKWKEVQQGRGGTDEGRTKIVIRERKEEQVLKRKRLAPTSKLRREEKCLLKNTIRGLGKFRGTRISNMGRKKKIFVS